MTVDIAVDPTPDSDTPDVTVIPVAVPETDSAVIELAREAGEGNALLHVLVDRVSVLEDRLENVETTVAVAIQMSVEASETAVEAAEVATEAALITEESEALEEPSDGITEPMPEEDSPPVRQHWLFREKGEWRNRK